MRARRGRASIVLRTPYVFSTRPRRTMRAQHPRLSSLGRRGGDEHQQHYTPKSQSSSMNGGNSAPLNPDEARAVLSIVVLKGSVSEGAILEADRPGDFGIGANGWNSALPPPTSFSWNCFAAGRLRTVSPTSASCFG